MAKNKSNAANGGQKSQKTSKIGKHKREVHKEMQCATADKKYLCFVFLLGMFLFSVYTFSSLEKF